jgi:hypothetical protein
MDDGFVGFQTTTRKLSRWKDRCDVEVEAIVTSSWFHAYNIIQDSTVHVQSTVQHLTDNTERRGNRCARRADLQNFLMHPYFETITTTTTTSTTTTTTTVYEYYVSYFFIFILLLSPWSFHQLQVPIHAIHPVPSYSFDVYRTLFW